MSNPPLVSVVTPTYNRARFIGTTIESVLNQTFPDWEMHVVDDGSIDNTREVVKPYLADNRVHYYHQENQGQAVARNQGLRNAQGRFICFLDSDDCWKADKLERQIRIMEQNPGVDIIYGREELIDADGNVLGEEDMPRYSGQLTKRLLVTNCIPFSTTMTRRKCFDDLGGMDESVRLGDDYELWLRFSARYQFLFVPEIYGQYRIMDNRISSNPIKRLEYNQKVIEKFLANNPGIVSTAYQRFVWSRFYRRRGNCYATVGKSREAAQDYFRALMWYPLTSGPWRGLAKLVLLRRQP